MVKKINIDDKIAIGGKHTGFILLAGVCVIESEEHTLKVAERLKGITDKFKIPLVFKGSYDKANRSSITSFRGIGIKKGLKVLEKVKERFGIPVLTDVHCKTEIDDVAEVVDVIQIPAFLCRQTDLIVEVARTQKVVNIKKGQFLSPSDIVNTVRKVESQKNKKIILTERGFSFGYNNLVTDFRALPIMRDFSYPVVFDATHSVQLPGGEKFFSGGERKFVPYLSRAAAAVGMDGLFLEVHDNPSKALCDGPNAVALKDLTSLLEQVKLIDELVKTEKMV